ncbi:MAG: hypothetical protein JXB00_16490 [Bacteroidales bacterium]|nr:hypothetical protein [Bacteroidales bacterium]
MQGKRIASIPHLQLSSGSSLRLENDRRIYASVAGTQTIHAIKSNLTSGFNLTLADTSLLTGHLVQPAYKVIPAEPENHALYTRTTVLKKYELIDHLGNVRAVISDSYVNNAMPDYYADYYPGDMVMPGRTGGSESNYRFGYQGQFAEKDHETGYNQFEARLYDARIGRWMIPDPAGQYWSPYLGMGNNWVNGVEPDGEKVKWSEDLGFVKRTWGKIFGFEYTWDQVASNGMDMWKSIEFRLGKDVIIIDPLKITEAKCWLPVRETFMDKWSQSNNIFASFAWDIVDGIAVTAQSMVLGPDARHINNRLVSGSDRIDAFVNTAPAIFAVEAKAAQAIPLATYNEYAIGTKGWFKGPLHSHLRSVGYRAYSKFQSELSEFNSKLYVNGKNFLTQSSRLHHIVKSITKD